MKTKKISSMAMLAGALALSACGDSSQPIHNSQNLPGFTEPSTGAAQGISRQVSFDFNISALLEKEIQSPQNDRTIKALAANLMTGTLQVENLDTAEVESHPWTINLDENDLGNVQSLKTIALEPANYVFSIVLNRDDHQYVGTSVHTLLEDATDLVPMTIRPVIGDSQLDVTVIETLVDFKFNFSEADINNAGLVSPSMGIAVDGGPEQVFTLDPATGLSEYMYLNLIPGNYDIALRLFDGNIQVGKSVQEQGTAVTVSTGLDVSMDIIPLYAELALALGVEGDDAFVTINIPAEVIEEAGDVSNLQAILSVVGPDFPLQETELTLNSDGVGYIANTILTSVLYGELSFELAFYDRSDFEDLGSCVDSVVVNSGATTVECLLTLRRRAVVAGSLLSTVGVNVFDANGDTVPGAVVSIDGEEVAITNSAVFSTEGYSKLYVKPGTHSIRAQSGADFGELSFESNPLSVDNIEIVLDQVEDLNTLFADDFNGNQSGSAAPIGYWFGCLAKGSYQGYIGSGKLYLGSRYNNTNNDWCWGTSALTYHSFTDTEITDAGGFTVSADVASAAAVNSVVTIALGGELGTDPTVFYPHLTADAIVNVRDNDVQVLLYEGGTNTRTSSYTTPIAAQFIENVTLDVVTDSFAAGAAATMNVIINGDPNLVPPIDFTWDGGSNHVEVKGSAGNATNGGGVNYVEIESLAINPR